MIHKPERLMTIKKDLADVVRLADTYLDFDIFVVEGIRTKERQKVLFEKGASRTMDSRHLTGDAVDLAPMLDGQLRWDWPLFYPLADAMKRAARELEVAIEWGGDWKSFRDGPHFQLKGNK